MSTDIQLYLFLFSEESIIFDGFQNCSQFITKEDGYDSRRSFVTAQTVIVAGAGCRYTHQICIFIYGFDDSHQKYQELDILCRCASRI